MAGNRRFLIRTLITVAFLVIVPLYAVTGWKITIPGSQSSSHWTGEEELSSEAPFYHTSWENPAESTESAAKNIPQEKELFPSQGLFSEPQLNPSHPSRRIREEQMLQPHKAGKKTDIESASYLSHLESHGVEGPPPLNASAERIEQRNSSIQPTNLSRQPVPGEVSSPEAFVPPQRLQDLLQALRELGAVQYQLETWGENGSLYRFHCQVGLGRERTIVRHFEHVGADPVEVVGQVLADVQSQLSPPPGR